MDDDRWERISRTIEYLTNQQASSDSKFCSWIDKADRIIESLEQAVHRHDGLVETLFSLQESTQRKLAALADALLHTDERLNALIGFVDSRLNGPPLTN